ncbi:DNA-directed DNA polymerase [Zostera marina]|uniref:DNA polymerase eta n=1 Tax=Zostera marina TaxID=29655 RepID=A0A0K9PEX9_ZOSMR|nr:DNA-directed DNA polymerase [Zostera marina]
MIPIGRPESHREKRVIAHIDMDCFYVQVEQRKNPKLRGLPTAVVQYNSWKGGGLIAVGYEARTFGVKRSMRGDEAKKVCPDIHLIQVPTARGKANLNLYRDAGSEVVSILAAEGRCERASIDEVYLDLTDAAERMLSEMSSVGIQEIDEQVIKSHILGLPKNADEMDKIVKDWICKTDADHQDKLLACGAIIVARLRMNVLKETTFTCSAGIAHNKMLAKLASAMHKPAQQTIVPSSSIKELLASFPIKKMKQLGGKLGVSLERELGISFVGDLLQYSKEKLQDRYNINTGTWLWNIARGINAEEVQGRLLPKSHGCGKTFAGSQALKTAATVEHWLNELCEELNERIQADLEKNKRVAKTLTLHATAFKSNNGDFQKKFPSKSCPLRYGAAKIKEDAFKLFDFSLKEFISPQGAAWGVTSLSVTASKFLAIPSGTSSILRFLSENHSKQQSSSVDSDELSIYGTDLEIVYETSPKKKTNSSIHEESVICRSISAPTKCNKKSNKIKQKNKEACSIFKYFHSNDASSSILNEPSVNEVVENYTSSCQPENECSVELIEDPDCNEITSNNQPANKTESWKYNADNIDLTVIDELPLEIQNELKEWLRPYKQAKMAKKYSIADYFSPSKK